MQAGRGNNEKRTPQSARLGLRLFKLRARWVQKIFVALPKLQV